jgi:hypothetical protein
VNSNTIHQFFIKADGLPGLESRDVHEEIPERMPVQGLEQPIILKISPLVIDTIITLLLSDYVMHDHTKNHDLPHLYPSIA